MKQNDDKMNGEILKKYQKHRCVTFFYLQQIFKEKNNFCSFPSYPETVISRHELTEINNIRK